MAIDEAARHRLHTKLEEALGSYPAAALMEMLPPVGWADVATKRDLDQLAVATKRDLDQLADRNEREHMALKLELESRWTHSSIGCAPTWSDWPGG